MIQKYGTLLLWILAFEAISLLIGRAIAPGVSGWYAGLTAPPLTPPNIAFPVMWTILYAMIAAAGWLAWQHRGASSAQFLLVIFALYMALNWSWSFIFFGAHLLLTGFIWIILINFLSILFIRKSWNTLRPAALLMILPTLWTLYAAYLNGGYWWLN